MRKLTMIKKAVPYIATILLGLFAQCERFVTLDSPANQITQEQVFRDKATALAALADMYAGLRDNGMLDGTAAGAHFLTALYTDDLQTASAWQSGFRPFYDLTLQSNSYTVENLWTASYKTIYSANNILEGVAESSEYIDQLTRNALSGEALAVRAMVHLYLTSLFGDVPYVNTTDYHINQNIAKSEAAAVLGSVKEDLLQAAELLPAAEVSADKTRLGRTAVQLLLARVCLYQSDYNNAAMYARMVMADPELALETDLSKVFLKESSGTVWQFAPVEPGANTWEAQTYYILDTPPPYAFLSENLTGSFENGDLRKTAWVSSIQDGTVVYSFPSKYRQYTKTDISQEYAVMLRLEEAVLIAAEAEARLGNTGEAIAFLKKIRLRAGLSTPDILSPENVMDLVMQERRHELFTEGAHRFFDLKRWDLLDTVMPSVKTQWQPFMKNWPLPYRELQLNQNLKPQNYGY